MHLLQALSRLRVVAANGRHAPVEAEEAQVRLELLAPTFIEFDGGDVASQEQTHRYLAKILYCAFGMGIILLVLEREAVAVIFERAPLP